MTSADPFGTAQLRRTVLDAWAASPGRFREDANAEESLALTGYAGRVVVELAANAADAALAAGVPGHLKLRVVDGELRAANTGAPLTAAGVAALASLRASAKRESAGVGHFGVGFTAVLTITDEPRVVSRTGGVRFGAADTAAALAGLGNAELDAEIASRAGHLPILRLAWPAADQDPVPAGFDTEVRLPLRPGVDPEQVLAAVDDSLLLSLPGLHTIETERRRLTRVDLTPEVTGQPAAPGGSVGSVDTGGPDRTRLVGITDNGVLTEWSLHTRTGQLPAELLAGRPVEERGRTEWWITWAATASPTSRPDVVHAPTPTDEPLLLPARLIGTFPVDDTRRRLAVGPLTDHLLDQAVEAYRELVRQAPPELVTSLVPEPGFGLGPIDTRLRTGIVEALRFDRVLTTVLGDRVRPSEATVLPGASDRLAQLLGEAVPGLLFTPVDAAARRSLRTLGVGTSALHQISSALSGIDRDASFWGELYRELSLLAAVTGSSSLTEDLADLPVRLADGRTVIGVRGCLLPGSPEVSELAARIVESAPGVRLVEPACVTDPAARELLVRLGAVEVDPDVLLGPNGLLPEMSALRADLDQDEVDEELVESLGSLVLDLVAAGGRPSPALRQALVLTDQTGEPWPAAQLLLPGAPLASVLDADADLPIVATRWHTRYPRDVLAQAGLLHGFRVVHDPDAGGPDHDLADEDDWWDGEDARPGVFRAVADLDLVDPGQWPAALELLAADPDTRSCVLEEGYTRWWLRGNVLLAGNPPDHWAAPGAVDLAGLYPPLSIELPAAVARAIGVQFSLAEAVATDPAEVLRRLADPDRPMPAASAGPALLALAGELVRHPEMELPVDIRTMAGTVRDAAEVTVLDGPWWTQVVPADRLVPGGEDPPSVSRVFDLPLTGDVTTAVIHGTGVPVAIGTVADLVPVRDWFGWPELELLTVLVDPDLTVVVDEAAHRVCWWVGGDQVTVDGSPAGWARALAHLTGRWELRNRLEDLIGGARWRAVEATAADRPPCSPAAREPNSPTESGITDKRNGSRG